MERPSCKREGQKEDITCEYPIILKKLSGSLGSEVGIGISNTHGEMHRGREGGRGQKPVEMVIMTYTEERNI